MKNLKQLLREIIEFRDGAVEYFIEIYSQANWRMKILESAAAYGYSAKRNLKMWISRWNNWRSYGNITYMKNLKLCLHK